MVCVWVRVHAVACGVHGTMYNTAGVDYVVWRRCVLRCDMSWTMTCTGGGRSGSVVCDIT